MATGYFVNDTPLEDLVVQRSILLEKMITSDNFFDLGSIGFSSNDTTKFAKSITYNGGTWGVPINTGYCIKGSPIPFINPESIPNPYLVQSNATSFLRQFPEEDWVNNYGTSGKFIPGSDIETTGIKISYNNQQLTVKKGDDTDPFIVKASPYILIDIQAPGGDGGEGIGDWDNWSLTKYFALSGGGGGSSGSFVSLSANLTDLGVIEIKDPQPQSSTHYEVTCQGKKLNIGKGTTGKRGRCKAEPAQGSGSSVLYAYGGDSQSAADINIDGKTDLTFNDNIAIIVAYNGNKGAQGAATTTRWADREANTKNGTSAGAITSSILLTSVPGSNIACTLYDSTKQATGGTGELTTSPTVAALIAGGGGGGASLMANGRSHGDSSFVGIGAGGCGGSAWSNDDTQLFGTEVCDWLLTPYNDVIKSLSQPGSSGGPGAMWIYYKPALCNISIDIATSTWQRPVSPGNSAIINYTGPVATTANSFAKTVLSGDTLQYKLYAAYKSSGYLTLSVESNENAEATLSGPGSGGIYTLTISKIKGDVAITIKGKP